MITAILIIYNHAKFLENCISAISAQGDLISKIIVVSDASTDNTIHVLNGIKARESRLFHVTNKENLGVVGGFKTGLQYVETDFLLLTCPPPAIPKW